MELAADKGNSGIARVQRTLMAVSAPTSKHQGDSSNNERYRCRDVDRGSRWSAHALKKCLAFREEEGYSCEDQEETADQFEWTCQLHSSSSGGRI